METTLEPTPAMVAEALAAEVAGIELVAEDGIPMDSDWHRKAMNLLIGVIWWLFRDRDDYYVGGDMFIYFSAEQARNRDFRGPDFFYVDKVNRLPAREYWAVWLEGMRFPDVILELTSPTTAEEDFTTKKDVYEAVFQTFEYYIYDRQNEQIFGWRLIDGHYETIAPDAQGRLECQKLGLWIGKWSGSFQGMHAVWPRFFDANGAIVPLPEEAEKLRANAATQRATIEAQRATIEAQRAAIEARRAEAAEREIVRLRALIAAQNDLLHRNGGPPKPDRPTS